MSCLRRHSRLGCSSSPTRNSSSTMPSSAIVQHRPRAPGPAQPVRPDQRAGDEIAEHRAEAEAAEQDDEDQRGAEHDHRRREAAQRSPRVPPGSSAAPACGGSAAAASAAASKASRIDAWRAVIAARVGEDVEAGPVARIVARAGEVIGERVAGFGQFGGASGRSHVAPISEAEAWPSAQARTS